MMPRMNRGGVLALLSSMFLGAGLAALGCGSEALPGKDGGRGGAGGTGAADGDIEGGGCLSDLFVDWQIQSPAGAAVTCDAAKAAQVIVSIDGVNHPQVCPSGRSSGSQDLVLPANYATYDVMVNLEDATGNGLVVPQATKIDVTSCASYSTPGPAILVVSPPAQ